MTITTLTPHHNYVLDSITQHVNEDISLPDGRALVVADTGGNIMAAEYTGTRFATAITVEPAPTGGRLTYRAAVTDLEAPDYPVLTGETDDLLTALPLATLAFAIAIDGGVLDYLREEYDGLAPTDLTAVVQHLTEQRGRDGAVKLIVDMLSACGHRPEPTLSAVVENFEHAITLATITGSTGATSNGITATRASALTPGTSIHRGGPNGPVAYAVTVEVARDQWNLVETSKPVLVRAIDDHGDAHLLTLEPNAFVRTHR